MQVPPIDPAHDASKAVHLSPPFVQIEGVLNCRGLPLAGTANPPSASKPWLLRSGDISRITPQGIEQLHSYGIRTVFDFRSPSDIAKFQSPAPVIDGIEIVKAPLLHDHADKPNEGRSAAWYESDNLRKVYAEYREDEQGAFMRGYTRVLEDGREVVAKVLRSLGDRKNGEGILFHCSAGKDRTGVVAAIILSLAGLDDSTIVHDYALTTSGLKPFAAVLLQQFEKDAAFQAEREGAMNMFSSRPETMRAFLALMGEKYGGAEGYARDIAGLSQTEIDAIKKNLK